MSLAVVLFIVLVVGVAIGGAGSRQASNPSAGSDSSSSGSSASQSTTSSSSSGSRAGRQRSQGSQSNGSTVGIGQTATVSDASWVVTNASPTDHLTTDWGETKRGNFVVVDFTNNGNESKTLTNHAVDLLDSSGRKSEADTDTIGYIPHDKDVFFEQVNPGVTKDGEIIFSVAPGASGFKLDLSNTNLFGGGKAYVDLGF